MFKNIVSQLSYSPAASQNLAYYARRLRQEKVTRTFSAVAAVLLVGLQMAAVTVPATPVNAASANDVIRGGITSKTELLSVYDKDASLRTLFTRFGISRNNLEAARDGKINSRDRSLMSLGRVHRFASDEAVVAGNETYYLRKLHLWDTGANVRTGSTYKVLSGARSDGSFFAVMYNCGNIVVKQAPPAIPAPAPRPALPAPVPAPVPAPPAPQPQPARSLSCTSLRVTQTSGRAPLKVTMTGQGQTSGQTIKSYTFDFGDGSPKKVQTQPVVEHVYARPGTYLARLQITGSNGQSTPASPACAVAITAQATPAALTQSKSALNLTQNIDATLRPAGGGDEIRYTLKTRNTGGTTAKAFVVKEDLTDVLEYADITDPNGGTLSGSVLTWEAADVPAGGTLTTSFTVRVKNPVPPTPAGISDRHSFDLKMDNVYGNDVRVSVEPPTPKQIEEVAQQLPETGPGQSMLLTFAFGALTIYFYARNRQLAAEVSLLRTDYERGLL